MQKRAAEKPPTTPGRVMLGYLKKLAISGALLSVCTSAALAEESIPVDETADFRGKVTDEANKPLSRVKVRLTDQVSGQTKTTGTDRDGQFWISTTANHPLALEFEPPAKAGLASAIYDNLPAREDRQLFVHLSRGFPVSGSITFSHRPLKDLQVRVVAESPANDREKICGGGRAVTTGNGSFHFLLTPGRKKMVIYNDKFGNIARQTVKTFTVSADLDLGEIDLSPSP